MFALGIRYLAGRAVATHPADRERAEWPPHPDRVFMALVAAWGETGRNADEEVALRWLEVLGAPEIAASTEEDVRRRTVVTTFVPVNDSAMPRLRADREPSRGQVASGFALLPASRPRQERHFPTVRPARDVVFLRWPRPLPEKHAAALSRLCRKVAYLGHSSSPVQFWLLDAEKASRVKADLRPSGKAFASMRLRIVGAGRLDALEGRHKAGLRPTSSFWAPYESATDPMPALVAPGTCFDRHLLVLRQVEGPRLPLATTAQVTRAFRDTLMATCPVQPCPEWISGHAVGGEKSEKDHLAILPLPHVGHEHADGHLLGLALAVPASLPSEDQGRCWRGLLFDDAGEPQPLTLRLGSLGVLTLELEDRSSPPAALKPETWTGANKAARRWGTVTPIALDRHPKKDDTWKEIEATIAAACERIGLKALVETVVLTPVSLFIGAPTNRGFPNLQRKSGGNIHHTHAIITFKEPVVGPLLLGSGRYRGYGLCRPLREEGLRA